MYVLGISMILFIGLMFFSPFKKQAGSKHSILTCTVEINAPVDSVFNFLGNSSNANKWSSFVNHISPLNAENFTDGSVGSQRRCFVQEDELGMRWDEEIIEKQALQNRKLSIFNLHEFPVSVDGLLTEQVYTKINDSTTKLSFSLFFDKDSPDLFSLIKMKLGCYRVKYVFDKNLENIKRICETGE